MKEYRFTGEFEIGRSKHSFERQVSAKSENHAEDVFYNQICGEHSINRSKIEVDQMEEV